MGLSRWLNINKKVKNHSSENSNTAVENVSGIRRHTQKIGMLEVGYIKSSSEKASSIGLAEVRRDAITHNSLGREFQSWGPSQRKFSLPAPTAKPS